MKSLSRGVLDGVIHSLEDLRKGLNSLQQLYLYNHSLSALPPEVFRGLNNLRELRLWDNSLTSLPEGVFAGLRNLEDLQLSHNPLSRLSEAVFRDLDNLRLMAYDRLFVDFAVINSGGSPAAAPFRIEHFLNGRLRETFDVSPPLDPRVCGRQGQGDRGIEDRRSIGVGGGQQPQ